MNYISELEEATQCFISNRRFLRFAYLYSTVEIYHSYKGNNVIDEGILEARCKFEQISPYEAISRVRLYVDRSCKIDAYPSPKKAVNSLFEKYQTQLISENAFNWIDVTQPRLCYFVWIKLLYIKLPRPAKNNFRLETKNEYQGTHWITSLLDFNFPNRPKSSAECKELIILYIDSWNAHHEQKLRLIDALTEAYNNFNFYSHKLLNQIDKSNLAIQKWMWSTLMKKQKIKDSNLQPISDEQILNFPYIVLFLYYFEYPIDSKKKEIDALYSALQSRKHYQLKKDNTDTSIILSEEASLKLSALAEMSKVSKKKLINELIDKQFVRSNLKI